MKLFETICILTFVLYLSVTQTQGQFMCYDGTISIIQGTTLNNTRIVTCPDGSQCTRIDVELTATIAGVSATAQQSQGSCVPSVSSDFTNTVCDSAISTVQSSFPGTASATCCAATCTTSRCNDVPATSITNFQCRPADSRTTGAGAFSGSPGLVGLQPLKSGLMSLLVFSVVMIGCK